MKSRAYPYGLTVRGAVLDLNVFCLSQECGRLRRLGWKIESEFVRTSGGAHVKRYRLVC